MGNPDPDWFRFDNSDGKLERPDMRQFERDLDAAVAYTASAQAKIPRSQLTDLEAALYDALQLIQGFNWQLDDSPHGQEIKRRALTALALVDDEEQP